jgi:hypothetical protein
MPRPHNSARFAQPRSRCVTGLHCAPIEQAEAPPLLGFTLCNTFTVDPSKAHDLLSVLTDTNNHSIKKIKSALADQKNQRV